MLQTVRCSCGATLGGTTGESLLAAVERHAAEAHPSDAWRLGPQPLDVLRNEVAGLARRMETIERSLGAGRAT